MCASINKTDDTNVLNAKEQEMKRDKSLIYGNFYAPLRPRIDLDSRLIRIRLNID